VISRIANLFRTRQARSEGFVWASHYDDEPMRYAAKRKSISVEGRGPPWIVAFDSIEQVSVARWPGDLWRVRITDPASPKDQNWQVPYSSARYTRAVSVEVLEQISPASLFGPQGNLVEHVLNTALCLEKNQAVQLSQNRHPDAAHAYDRCFRSWLAFEGYEDKYPENLDGTLQIFSGDRISPVGYGLSLAHRLVFERAVELDGKDATATDHEEVWLLEPWNIASAAIADAVLGLGAEKHLSESDAKVLLHAWTATFGHGIAP
jgi:hypothetical protein